MEADGWALYKVRLGILFCFARCKPQDNVVYYVICEEGQKHMLPGSLGLTAKNLWLKI